MWSQFSQKNLLRVNFGKNFKTDNETDRQVPSLFSFYTEPLVVDNTSQVILKRL